jgi:hypothetical protein
MKVPSSDNGTHQFSQNLPARWRHMAKQSNLGGTFTFPNTPMTVKRMGYGAMRLSKLAFSAVRSGRLG